MTMRPVIPMSCHYGERWFLLPNDRFLCSNLLNWLITYARREEIAEPEFRIDELLVEAAHFFKNLSREQKPIKPDIAASLEQKVSPLDYFERLLKEKVGIKNHQGTKKFLRDIAIILEELHEWHCICGQPLVDRYHTPSQLEAFGKFFSWLKDDVCHRVQAETMSLPFFP